MQKHSTATFESQISAKSDISVQDPGPRSAPSLRAANRERLLGLLRSTGPMSQAELARGSELSPATVSSIVRELREEGRIEQAGDGGRRGAAIALSPDAGAAVGVDFGHSHVRVAVADLSHTVLSENAEPLDVDHSAAAGIALAGKLVREGLREAGVDPKQVTGVGMGLPAPLRRETGEVGDSAILPGWIGERPEAMMNEELGLRVRVENDANLGALAELVWGAGRGCSDLAYVKAASGVGAGLVLGGRLYRGHAGTAGELGHLTVDESGPICRCGNRGCLETFASIEAVVEPLRRTLGEGLELDEVIARAEDGDAGCTRSLADAGRALGSAIGGLCNLLAPERVIIGGELAKAGELLLGPLREQAHAASIAPMRETELAAGVLGARAEVLGAVSLVLRESERFVAEPEPVAG